jgi:hypothetical protein
MVLLRTLIAAIWILILLSGTNMWTKQSAPRHILTIPHPPGDTTTVLDGVSRTDDVNRDWADSRVDLNGNEVDDAVGDYRVDPRGEMYERHAPDTALPHLGTPST